MKGTHTAARSTAPTLGALASEFGGVVHGDPETRVSAVALDSRRANDGALFAALVAGGSWAVAGHALLPAA